MRLAAGEHRDVEMEPGLRVTGHRVSDFGQSGRVTGQCVGFEF